MFHRNGFGRKALLAAAAVLGALLLIAYGVSIERYQTFPYSLLLSPGEERRSPEPADSAAALARQATETPIPTPTAQPTETPIPTPTAPPTETPTPPPTETPIPTPTAPPTATPAPEPTSTPDPGPDAAEDPISTPDAPQSDATPTAAEQATATPVSPAQPTATPAPAEPVIAADGYWRKYEIDGQLSAGVWLDEERMYIASLEGDIWLLNADDGEARKVVEGLAVPQGLTIMGGRLYVSHLGINCHLMYWYIDAHTNPELLDGCRFKAHSEIRAERIEMFTELAKRSDAEILSYGIEESGDLSGGQAVVDKIVSTDLSHSVQGLANDGEYVYATIGFPEHQHNIRWEEVEAAGRRRDILGAVVRFSPPFNALEVFASGFRNMYDISIGPDGVIYGTDNDAGDGLIESGHREELNAIVEGGYYGYPEWGTNEAPPEAGVAEPVAVLECTASTATLASEAGIYATCSSKSSDRFIVDLFDYETFTPKRIFTKQNWYITDILEREGLLYLISLSGDVHIIDPSAAPVVSRN